MNKLLAPLIIFCFAATARATALADSAAAMTPGTWKALNTGLTYDMYGKFGCSFTFANNMLWDAVTEKIMFVGTCHGAKTQGILFDAKMNVWRSIPVPRYVFFADSFGVHPYDKLTMDTKNHVGYYYEDAAGAMRLYKFDFTSESWSIDSQYGAVPPAASYVLALAYFPEKDGLVYVVNGNVSFFDQLTKTWSLVTSGLLMGAYHNLAEYNPIYQCVYFGGGNTFTPQPHDGYYMYRMDTSGRITPLKKAPFPIGISSNVELTCDRVSGEHLVLRNDSLYGYNILDDYWYNLGPNPGHDPAGGIVTPIPEYGVVAFLSCGAPYNMRLYKYTGAYDTLSVEKITIRSQADTLELNLKTYLSAMTEYAGGGKDTSNTRCGFLSLDTDIVQVSQVGGVVTAKNTGQGRVVVMKRGVRDTMTLTVVPSTATLDSVSVTGMAQGLTVKLLIGQFYGLHATGYYHKEAQAFTRNVDSLVSWSSTNTLVASVDADGLVTAMGAGSAGIVALLAGKSDTLAFSVQQEPAFIKRINFQVSSTPWSNGWEADNGGAFSTANGFGWTSAPATAREDRGGSNYLLKTFVTTNYVTSNPPDGYRVDCPDGEYVIKYGLGDNNSTAGRDSLWFGTRLLCAHNGAGNTIKIDTVAVTGGNGLNLSVFNTICYLVVISSEGTDINELAWDDGECIPLYGTARETRRANGESVRFQTYPNPFNPNCRISLFLPAASGVSLGVYDLNGKLLRTLVSGRMGPGNHQVMWDAKDGLGRTVSAGVYVYRLQAGGRVLSTKAVLAK